VGVVLVRNLMCLPLAKALARGKARSSSITLDDTNITRKTLLTSTQTLERFANTLLYTFDHTESIEEGAIATTEQHLSSRHGASMLVSTARS
jgi:hypothetical protein